MLKAPLESTLDGLTECVALLDPQEGGSTLALSSTRSEALKGFIVRMGEKVIKGELLVKLGGLGNTKKGYNLSISDEGIILTQVPPSPLSIFSLSPVLLFSSFCVWGKRLRCRSWMQEIISPPH